MGGAGSSSGPCSRASSRAGSPVWMGSAAGASIAAGAPGGHMPPPPFVLGAGFAGDVFSWPAAAPVALAGLVGETRAGAAESEDGMPAEHLLRLSHSSHSGLGIFTMQSGTLAGGAQIGPGPGSTYSPLSSPLAAIAEASSAGAPPRALAAPGTHAPAPAPPMAIPPAALPPRFVDTRSTAADAERLLRNFSPGTFVIRLSSEPFAYAISFVDRSTIAKVIVRVVGTTMGTAADAHPVLQVTVDSARSGRPRAREFVGWRRLLSEQLRFASRVLLPESGYLCGDGTTFPTHREMAKEALFAPQPQCQAQCQAQCRPVSVGSVPSRVVTGALQPDAGTTLESSVP